MKPDWQISENSGDSVVETILQHAVELKKIGSIAEQSKDSVNLSMNLLLPFSDTFKVLETMNTNSPTPTSDELFTFFTNTTKNLSRVRSAHILGSIYTRQQWLYVCELRGSILSTPVLVLFHSTWTPKTVLALYGGRLTSFNPDEWQSEFEVIMPPSAWDIDGAWNRFLQQ
jgi:hypothetical protein